VRTHLITKCWKVANSVQTLARRFMLRRSAVSASSKRLSHNTNTKLTVEKSATTILPNSEPMPVMPQLRYQQAQPGRVHATELYKPTNTMLRGNKNKVSMQEQIDTKTNRDKKGERLFETRWIVTHTYHPFEPGLQHMRVLHLI
jgi:hypothetical protein